MTLTLRSVKGAPLTSAELDGNFTDHETRIVALEMAEETPPTIDSDVSGTTWTLTINGDDFIHSIPQAAYAPPSVLTDSGSLVSLGSAHVNAYTRCTNATACTVSISTNASTPIGANSECVFRQAGDGPITFEGADGVTINPQFGCTLVTAGRGATVMLKKVATNEWDACGQFEAA